MKEHAFHNNIPSLIQSILDESKVLKPFGFEEFYSSEFPLNESNPTCQEIKAQLLDDRPNGENFKIQFVIHFVKKAESKKDLLLMKGNKNGSVISVETNLLIKESFGKKANGEDNGVTWEKTYTNTNLTITLKNNIVTVRYKGVKESTPLYDDCEGATILIKEFIVNTLKASKEELDIKL